jgi:hypothetical protein
VSERTQVVGVESDLGLDALGLAVVAFAVRVACHDCCMYELGLWALLWCTRVQGIYLNVSRYVVMVGLTTSSSMDLSGFTNLYQFIQRLRSNTTLDPLTKEYQGPIEEVFEETYGMSISECLISNTAHETMDWLSSKSRDWRGRTE